MTAPATPGSVEAPRLRYIPALDGMRGLSLPGTILTHFALLLDFDPSAPGWLHHVGPFTLNIQMFFVLSGALITSLLVAEQQRTGAVSLKKFYLRRSRRLGPALIAVLPLVAIIALAWPGQGIYQALGNHPLLALGSVAIFLGNWVLFRISGGLGWLGPAWTLGIEEQFYLTWPLVLRLAMKRRLSRRAILVGLGVALLASLVITELIFRHVGGPRAFYATPTNLPSILLGCALGYELTSNPNGRLMRLLQSRLVALTGFAGMVLVSWRFNSRSILFHGGYALYAGFACLLIGHCFAVAGKETAISRFLGWRPFVVIGQISYEAYLIHIIIIFATVRAFPHMHVYPVILLDTVLVAAVSATFYYLVEQPIRRRGWRAVLTRSPAPS